MTVSIIVLLPYQLRLILEVPNSNRNLSRDSEKGRELRRRNAVVSVMERDPFDAAIDAILASADGDIRRALRAVLVENVVLESELRQLYAVSEHGKPTNWRSLH
jgi:hypothetical protein